MSNRRADPAGHAVEVNEGVVEASQQGADWWRDYRLRHQGTGRIRDVKPACIVGGVVEVACDNREDADWLAKHMVEHAGLPRTAVRVRRQAVVTSA